MLFVAIKLFHSFSHWENIKTIPKSIITEYYTLVDTYQEQEKE